MATSFRLLHAKGAFERSDIFNAAEHRNKESLSVQFSDTSLSETSAWVSVIIGKNGVGKSRLLAGIANRFDWLDRGLSARKSDDLSVSSITYFCDGQVCSIETGPNARPAYGTINGQRCKLEDLPTPTKIIALTTTPFDKFRVPPSVVLGRPAGGAERYSYLGLRDRSGRASTTAAIFRAIEGLFEASGSQESRRERMCVVRSFGTDAGVI